MNDRSGKGEWEQKKKRAVVGNAAAGTRAHDLATYRRVALALPGAVEGSHMGAADFRVGGRIFATLAYGHMGLGTLMLTPEQQAMFLAEAPEYFSAVAGGWVERGRRWCVRMLRRTCSRARYRQHSTR